MVKLSKLETECIYGSSAAHVCVNANCRKPAFICERGLNMREECALFHENCEKVPWALIEAKLGYNPNLESSEFKNIDQKMEQLFSGLIRKIQEEHAKFRIWVKTYGLSADAMSLIKLLQEGSFSSISGTLMSSIYSQLANSNRKNIELPNISDNQINLASNELKQALQHISDIYLRPNFELSKALSSTTAEQLTPFSSRIVQGLNSIGELFMPSRIKSCRLLFRASDCGYSIKEFHRRCDDIPNTITLIETEFGKIIGGYTPVPWTSSKKQWAADKSMRSFIFSLSMREKFKLNLAQFAIACNPEKGPIFGCCDISISENSHKERSNAEFPISYNNTKYTRSPETSKAFTGSPKGQFLVRDWEVFQVEFD